MWIYSLGETLKRATATSHAATSRLSELCQVFSDMTRPQALSRASLMHLLDVSTLRTYVCTYFVTDLQNIFFFKYIRRIYHR